MSGESSNPMSSPQLLTVLKFQMLLSGDDRYRTDATIMDMRGPANDLLDRFLDVSWLAWGEPVGLQ
jgi:hypothetical protein